MPTIIVGLSSYIIKAICSHTDHRYDCQYFPANWANLPAEETEFNRGTAVYFIDSLGPVSQQLWLL